MKAKIFTITSVVLAILSIVWFGIGVCYENHYGPGIIANTPSLKWIEDVMVILLCSSGISFVLMMVYVIREDN